MKRPAWVIVPAKSLLHGKSRLSPVLGDEDRARFAQRLLEHVLDVVGACALDGVLVATGGDDVASLATLRGAHVLRDRGAQVVFLSTSRVYPVQPLERLALAETERLSIPSVSTSPDVVNPEIDPPKV